MMNRTNKVVTCKFLVKVIAHAIFTYLHKVGSCVAWLHEMFRDSNEIFCEICDITKKSPGNF